MQHKPPTTTRVEKPWDHFEQYAHNLPSTVKIITVEPGGTLSYRYHRRRDEIWVALDEGARVEIGERTLSPRPGDELFIPRRTAHRLSCAGDVPVRILEISLGVFDEDDIVRLTDALNPCGPLRGPRRTS